MTGYGKITSIDPEVSENNLSKCQWVIQDPCLCAQMLRLPTSGVCETWHSAAIAMLCLVLPCRYLSTFPHMRQDMGENETRVLYQVPRCRCGIERTAGGFSQDT